MSPSPKPTFFAAPGSSFAELKAQGRIAPAGQAAFARRLAQLIDACAEGRRIDGLKPVGGQSS